MSGVSKWDRIVTKAWFERNDSQSRWWHPAKAAQIYARYTKNIDRAERYLTAERMAKRYKYSSYTAFQRARDHAISYPTTAWQWEYWSDVANIISDLAKKEDEE